MRVPVLFCSEQQRPTRRVRARMLPQADDAASTAPALDLSLRHAPPPVPGGAGQGFSVEETTEPLTAVPPRVSAADIPRAPRPAAAERPAEAAAPTRREPDPPAPARPRRAERAERPPVETPQDVAPPPEYTPAVVSQGRGNEVAVRRPENALSTELLGPTVTKSKAIEKIAAILEAPQDKDHRTFLEEIQAFCGQFARYGYGMPVTSIPLDERMDLAHALLHFISQQEKDRVSTLSFNAESDVSAEIDVDQLTDTPDFDDDFNPRLPAKIHFNKAAWEDFIQNEGRLQYDDLLIEIDRVMTLVREADLRAKDRHSKQNVEDAPTHKALTSDERDRQDYKIKRQALNSAHTFTLDDLREHSYNHSLEQHVIKLLHELIRRKRIKVEHTPLKAFEYGKLLVQHRKNSRLSGISKENAKKDFEAYIRSLTEYFVVDDQQIKKRIKLRTMQVLALINHLFPYEEPAVSEKPAPTSSVSKNPRELIAEQQQRRGRPVSARGTE